MPKKKCMNKEDMEKYMWSTFVFAEDFNTERLRSSLHTHSDEGEFVT